jgi:hypothetical protein
MYSTCRAGESGFWKDPFGYAGPEEQRPWVWGVLLNARRQYEYQEQQIGWYCKLDPRTGGYEYPHYPPTDRARHYPRLFDNWVTAQQALDKLKNTGSLEKPGRWVSGEVTVHLEHDLYPTDRGYGFFDAEFNRNVVFDDSGVMCDPC